jgi:hypothetical protein
MILNFFGHREYACTENAKGHTSLQRDGLVLPIFHQKLSFHYGPHHEIFMQNKGV